MKTYTQILYHVVFGTKHRLPCLRADKRKFLFHYIWKTISNKNCRLYRINGVEDHIHILTHIHPTVALSSLVRDIKVSSNFFIKQKQLFPEYRGWQSGFGAFTHHINDKDRLIEYIKKQQEHHKKVSWPDEFRDLLAEHGVVFDEKFLL